ncbi:hypothetical protein GMORB2_5461 [Geosmithia morbida]|uniref:Uncharacterized protein n=1 Tax=Geosmithia morbida TaxID=1094350 RepID=A0A9P4YZA5_9HYPO|nr:uncharacterized protein GMORB2_5461 [Geosmithia morbida]KAF4124795.1 hypothetical protein GMORB2_5461 [Geosmithia morbida]
MLPTPPATHPGSNQSGRRRRAENSSSSSGESTRGVFGISCIKYRVGTPPLPPAPFEYEPGVDVLGSSKGSLSSILGQKAVEILGKNDICQAVQDDYDPCMDSGFSVLDNIPELVRRTTPHDRSNCDNVLAITAWWDSRSLIAWEKAVREIKEVIDRILDHHGLKDVEIGVEIQAPEVRWKKTLSAVTGQPELSRDWPDIKAKVARILEGFEATKGHIYESAEKYWSPVEEAIQGYLDTLPYGLVVHIENNTMVVAGFDLQEPTSGQKEIARDYNLAIPGEYTQRPGPGQDICASRYMFRADGKKLCSTVGTLGCYLQVKTRRHPEWTKYALTNYHVVRNCIEGNVYGVRSNGETDEQRPLPGSALARSYINGFIPDETPNMSSVENPSRLKHNYTVWSAGQSIAYLENKAQKSRTEFEDLALFRARQNERIQFFDEGKNELGSLWCGSGLKNRSPGNRRLDWALLKVTESRQGSNSLPSREYWVSEYSLKEYIPPMTTALVNPTEDETLQKACERHDLVFKIGASTQLTAGRFSNHEADISLPWDRHIPEATRSTESCFLVDDSTFRTRRPITLRGDSGAVVYNESGAVVGLLFSGQTPQQSTSGYMLVTPIQDVFEDIKRLSKGQVTDIRVAVD